MSTSSLTQESAAAPGGARLTAAPMSHLTAYADVEAAVRAEMVAVGVAASPAALDAAVTRLVTVVRRFALEWAET